MSEMAPEVGESEASFFEGEGEGEASPEGQFEGIQEGPEAEATQSDAYWRARWQQIMRDRRQQAPSRRPQAPSALPRRQVVTAPSVTAPSQRQAMTAVSNLALDTQVETASIRRKVDDSTRLDDWNMYVAVVEALSAQVLDTYQSSLGNHPNIRAAVRLGPIALLRRKKAKRGFEGFLTNPALLTAAGALAILGSGRIINASRGVRTINIAPPGTLSPGATGTFAGVAVAGDGKPLPTIALTWASLNSSILTINNASTGAYTAGQTTGQVLVTAQAQDDGVTNGIFVTVEAPSSSGVSSSSSSSSSSPSSSSS
jgi:hypothetical protein